MKETKLTKETWKNAEFWGYVNYSVSNFGSVRNDKNGKMLNPCKNSNGYYIVSLSTHSIVKKLKIHRMVALLFCDGDKSLVVNHIDGNRLNNRWDNLEWVSQTDNLNHAYETGLTDKFIKKVKCITSGVIYESSYSASKIMGISQGSISNACSGVRKSAGGHNWEWILN